MSGYNTVLKIHSLEKDLDELGLKMCQPDYQSRDEVAIKPKDNNSLPIYARDAQMFVGTIDGLESWVKGVQWAREYDRMMFGNKHNEKRERKEQDCRNEEVVRLLKQ